MKTNANDPAHPHPNHKGISGMTKREYFAAMAMQGFTSIDDNGVFSNHDEAAKLYADLSVKYADALINALNSQP